MKRKEEVLAVVEQSNKAEGEVELSQAVSAVERQAQGILIRTDDDYKAAAEFGRMLKQKSSQVTEFFAPMKKAAHEAHKHICDREKAMLAPIANAEKLLKRTMGEYQMEQQRKRQEEEERLRALAKAEEERLLAEAIKMEEMGEKEMSEEHFENAQFMADAARTVVVPNETVKAAGVSSTIDWEIDIIDPSKVPVEFMNEIIRPVDEKSISRLVRKHKGNVSIPGVRIREVAKIAFRK